MIALRRLWRYLPTGQLETVEKGQRCDWARGGVYEQLGWAKRIK